MPDRREGPVDAPSWGIYRHALKRYAWGGPCIRIVDIDLPLARLYLEQKRTFGVCTHGCCDTACQRAGGDPRVEAPARLVVSVMWPQIGVALSKP